MDLYEEIRRLFYNAPRTGFANAFLILTIALTVSGIVRYRRGVQAVGGIPGLRGLFFTMSVPGSLIPTTWWNPGLCFTWLWKGNVYRQFGTDTISFVSYLTGRPAIYTSNINVARQVSTRSKERSYWKPEWSSAGILGWGMNLLAADGEVWRRHRRVVGPAFNNDLYKLVWSVTLTTYREMIDAEGFADKNEIIVPQMQSLTFKLALLVLGRCGFGFNFSWSEPAITPDGKMSVQEALRVVTDTHLLALIVPKFLRKIIPIKRWNESFEAQEHLLAFMQAQVAERKADIRACKMDTASRKLDAFSMLVKANEDNTSKFKLNDEELIGNVYIMLFAGHETTAFTIAATIGFLAYYPELQKEVYEQIISVVGHVRDPEFEEYSALDKILCAFFEALRFFPPAYVLLREAFEDTMLQIPNPLAAKDSDETITVPISKGTMIVVDMIGAQYNPRYFNKPTEYIPSRWNGVSVESEATTAFGLGQRICIGRKFATMEVVSFLTMLLRDFHVEPLLEKGETKEQWKVRVLDGEIAMTLGVKGVPVKFVRRRRV